MTRTAFSVWNERIAPVFDVARHIVVIDSFDGQVVGKKVCRFSNDKYFDRAVRLSKLKVEQLVCGALSRGAYEAVSGRNIRVVSFVAGDLNQVVLAWLSSHLDDANLAMPGCGGAFRTKARAETSGISENCGKEK